MTTNSTDLQGFDAVCVTFGASEIASLAWVLEYVAETRESDEKISSVVFAALQLVDALKLQLESDEIAQLDRYLNASRTLRHPEATKMWKEDITFPHLQS